METKAAILNPFFYLYSLAVMPVARFKCMIDYKSAWNRFFAESEE